MWVCFTAAVFTFKCSHTTLMIYQPAMGSSHRLHLAYGYSIILALPQKSHSFLSGP